MIKEKNSEDNTLAEKNLGLVHLCAKKFAGRGIEYDDLYGAGCLGLVKAAKGFDETLGFAFSTYAVPAILGEIKRLFRDGGSVKVSRSVREKARNAMYEYEMLEKDFGREPTVSELAERIGESAEETALLLGAVRTPLSLTADAQEEDGQADLPVESPEDRLVSSIFLRELLETLDDGDRRLLELRYYKGFTQSKTAQTLGMTQVGVSRKEKRLLLALRQRAEEQE